MDAIDDALVTDADAHDGDASARARAATSRSARRDVEPSITRVRRASRCDDRAIDRRAADAGPMRGDDTRLVNEYGLV